MTGDWSLSLSESRTAGFSKFLPNGLEVQNILTTPDQVVRNAALQKFAKITPQYPGVRSQVPEIVRTGWLKELSPVLDNAFDSSPAGWDMQAWFSLVTTAPQALAPMQRFPHVDGTDPRQIAMMLYLHETDHGGTGLFRHRSSGLTSLTDETFPQYRAALESDVRKSGIPPAAYVTDGEPLFERLYASEGAFNTAIFYRGNILHSGLISPSASLSADPSKGRLTINAFFRPKSA